MDPNILYIIIGVAALLLGLVAGKLIFAKNTRKKLKKPNCNLKPFLKKPN
jgi:ribonuclease Y